MVEVAVFVVQLIHQEDNGLLQLFGISEMILRAHFNAVGALEQQHAGISHIQGGQSTADKVITARAVDDIQLLPVPLHMIYGGEHAVAVLLLYREIIGDSVVLGDASATLDDTCFEKQAFRECCLTTTVIAKQGNVFNFMSLIRFHVC